MQEQVALQTRALDQLARDQHGMNQQIDATARAVERLFSSSSMEDSDSRDRPTKPSSSRRPPSHRPERPLRGKPSSSHPDPTVRRHHEARAEGHHYVPKMSFPLFDGSNPKIWIDKCTHYFQIQNISESSWVLTASLHMDGNASKWWQAYKLTNGMGTWEQFVQAIQEKFGSFDYKHAIDGLIEL